MSRTIRIPLSPGASLPIPPTSIQTSQNASSNLQEVISAVAQSKRIVVVCGAGISVDAGIPDFRSTEGIFQTLKRDNPELSSGKDLFDAKVFTSPATTRMFNMMIGNLAGQSADAHPTAFHQLLKALDDRGKLLRCYTQNIDCLEECAGLSYGIPAWNERRASPSKRTPKVKASPPKGSDSGLLTPPISRISQSASPSAVESNVSSPQPAAENLNQLAPVAPRCIPLHGSVKTLYCPRCSHTTSLAPHVHSLSNGESIRCASCEELDSTRRLVGKRERGVGYLRPSVVLYGEAHREGEVVGECVRRDLLGIQGNSWITVQDDGGSRGKGKSKGPQNSSKSRRKPDLLIVAGTSLKVPGTKSIVRQFSKQLRAQSDSSSPPTSRATPLPTEEEDDDDDSPIRSIFINLDFPVPSREWEGVFDVWLHGNVQTFASVVQEEFIRQEERAKIKEAQKLLRESKKMQREAESRISKSTPTSASKKRKTSDTEIPVVTPTKKQAIQVQVKRRLSINLNPTHHQAYSWEATGHPQHNPSPQADLLPTRRTSFTIIIPPIPIPTPPQFILPNPQDVGASKASSSSPISAQSCGFSIEMPYRRTSVVYE